MSKFKPLVTLCKFVAKWMCIVPFFIVSPRNPDLLVILHCLSPFVGRRCSHPQHLLSHLMGHLGSILQAGIGKKNGWNVGHGYIINMNLSHIIIIIAEISLKSLWISKTCHAYSVDCLSKISVLTPLPFVRCTELPYYSLIVLNWRRFSC